MHRHATHDPRRFHRIRLRIAVPHRHCAARLPARHHSSGHLRVRKRFRGHQLQARRGQPIAHPHPMMKRKSTTLASEHDFRLATRASRSLLPLARHTRMPYVHSMVATRRLTQVLCGLEDGRQASGGSELTAYLRLTAQCLILGNARLCPGQKASPWTHRLLDSACRSRRPRCSLACSRTCIYTYMFSPNAGIGESYRPE